MRELSNVSLAGRTTLRLGGPARRVVVAETADEVVEAVVAGDRAGERVLVMGGGSNLVVPDDGYDGTVVVVGSLGVRVAADDGCVVVTVAAGEPWDALVDRAVAEGWSGIECLAGIPGLTGATPVQNVGAYGQDVAQRLAGTRVLDRTTGEVRAMPLLELGLGYRTSALKGHDRYVVLDVELRLERSTTGSPLRYAELARRLGLAPGDEAPLADVRQAVLELRRAKGMVLSDDDPDTRSAGSFFTNPVLSAEEASRLPADAPRFPAADGVKTSAAWLIEHAGFRRGHAHGGARISTKHTLALTNPGRASTADLLALAREVRDGVRAAFGVELAVEPTLLGGPL